MIRKAALRFGCVVMATGLSLPGISQTTPELQKFFRNSIGLNPYQIADISAGKAVSKVLESRTPAEIFVFGAVYIKAAPVSYIQFATDFNRLRKLPEFLAIGKFSNPPRLKDLDGFAFDAHDIKALKECRPGHCEIQLPAESIEDFHKSINWEAPDLDRQVNDYVHQRVIQRLQAYRREGNQALGVYNDKRTPVNVASQFEHMLSYSRVLPAYLPDFYHYLLAYPHAKSPNIQDTFSGRK